jgi:hypothetical protein
VHRALLPFLLLPGVAHAQQSDEQLWLATTATNEPILHGELSLESIARFGDNAQGIANAQIGIAFRQQVAHGLRLGLGYRHVQDWDRNGARPNEERLRQSISFDAGSTLHVRGMLEERFQRSGTEAAIRLRPLARLSTALGRHARLFLWREDFFNLNTTGWGQRRGHERARHSAGVTVPLARRLSADIGYMHQRRFARFGNAGLTDHVGALLLTLRY